MSSARHADLTVCLELGEPRQFRGQSSQRTTYLESDLLSNASHVLLLGEPGSEKTTTLKRLARRILIEDASPGEIPYQFPLVIRLRELKYPTDLYAELLGILGLTSAVTVEVEESGENADQEDTAPQRIIHLGGVLLRPAIQQILNQSSPVLFVDGLDEIEAPERRAVRSDLESLARGLTTCKLIVTCRSGDYRRV